MIRSYFDIVKGYDICIAHNGVDGLLMHKYFNPDVIVSAIEIPIMNGKEMLRTIRISDSQIPFIFVTNRKDAKDFIEGIKLGADIYLRKPLIAEELNVQICALLKRVSIKSLPILENKECIIGMFGFNAANKYLRWHGKRIELSRTESKILDILISDKGQLVKRKDIIKILGKPIDFFSSRTLDVHIHKLRNILSKDPIIKIITVRGEGFILKETTEKEQ